MFFFLDKKVFPKYDILGWYSTGSDIQETDMQIHKTVSSNVNFMSTILSVFEW